MANSLNPQLGRVYLVGAGPGDPGAVTLRAAECLRQADVVLYDYLADPVILQHAAPAAERVCLGHHSTGRVFSQEEINGRIIESARQGKTVVHLKAGDPCIFGHSAEEVAALRAAGVPYELVPGITAGLAVADYAEIHLTQSDRTSAVALVTGHQRSQKDRLLDYADLASFPGTLVFYMGVTTAAEWSRDLIAGGRSPTTPVAIVRRCSWPDQQTLRCTLSTVADVIAREHLRPPAVIVVGEMAGLAPQVSWFAARPLHGQRVLLAQPKRSTGILPVPPSDRQPACPPAQDRPEARAADDDLHQRLTELGAQILVQPAVMISDPPDWKPVDAALARLDQYDWLVFSSSDGVHYLLERLLTLGGDMRRLGRVKLAAIGPDTAAELARYRLRADPAPVEYCAESLAKALGGKAAGRRFLLAQTNPGPQILPQQLAAAGAVIEQIVVYSTTQVQRADPDVAAALAAGQIDWVTVTSSAIARSLVALFGDTLRRTRLASIGSVTSGVLRELGCEPAVEAAESTMAGLLEAIVAAATR